MNCRESRDRLTSASNARGDSGLNEHLENCQGCRDYAARLGTARGLFRDHHADFEPDAAFAARVVEQLPQGHATALGWAAVRLLPVSIALVLALAWFAFGASRETTSVVEVQAPTDDLVSWVLEQSVVEGLEP